MAFLAQPVLPVGALFDNYVSPACSDLTSDGRKLAVASGQWKIFDLSTGKGVAKGNGGGGIAVRFSPNGSLLAIGGNYNLLWLLDARSGELLWDLTKEGHIDVINHLYFTPDNKKLISVSDGEKRIRVWDVQNKRADAVFHFTGKGTAWMGISLKLYVEKAKRVYELDRVERFIHQCAVTPDGKTLAVTAYPGKISFLELDSGKITRTIHLKQPVARSLCITPDGQWLLVGVCREDGSHGSVEIWDLPKNTLVATLGQHERSIGHLALSPDKKTLLCGAIDGFRVWDVASGKQKYSYFTREDPRLPKVTVYEDGSKMVEEEVDAAGAAFLPDGKTFLIIPAWRTKSTEVYFYDTATGEPVDYRKRVAALPQIGTAPR